MLMLCTRITGINRPTLVMIAIFFTSSAIYDILILEFFNLELSGMIQLIIETSITILGSLNWVLLVLFKSSSIFQRFN